MMILISIHGVRSRGRWQKNLDKYIKDSGRTDIKHIAYKYGWLPAYFIIFRFIRRYYTKRFKKFLYRKIYPIYGQENIYIVSHSFGTYISFHASKKGIHTKKLILFGSILHCRENFDGIVPEKIKEIHNFHSLEDEVTKYNPLGNAGHFGFRKGESKKWKRKPYKNLEVINHRLFLAEHTDYFPERFSDILKLLG